MSVIISVETPWLNKLCKWYLKFSQRWSWSGTWLCLVWCLPTSYEEFSASIFRVKSKERRRGLGIRAKIMWTVATELARSNSRSSPLYPCHSPLAPRGLLFGSEEGGNRFLVNRCQIMQDLEFQKVEIFTCNCLKIQLNLQLSRKYKMKGKTNYIFFRRKHHRLKMTKCLKEEIGQHERQELWTPSPFFKLPYMSMLIRQRVRIVILRLI